MTQPTKPKGRPLKGKENRKAVTFRLQPSTIALIREAAASKGISQSDLIERTITGLFAVQILLSRAKKEKEIQKDNTFEPGGVVCKPCNQRSGEEVRRMTDEEKRLFKMFSFKL